MPHHSPVFLGTPGAVLPLFVFIYLSLSGGLVCHLRLHLFPSDNHEMPPSADLPKQLLHTGRAASYQAGSSGSASSFCLSEGFLARWERRSPTPCPCSHHYRPPGAGHLRSILSEAPATQAGFNGIHKSIWCFGGPNGLRTLITSGPNKRWSKCSANSLVASTTIF